MIRRLAHQALAAFNAWRERRRSVKASADLARRVALATPEITRLQRQIAERARRHRTVEPLRRQLRAVVIARLAREQGRPHSERWFS